jgi:hypothetical protein
VFVTDAVIYLWDFNGRQMTCMVLQGQCGLNDSELTEVVRVKQSADVCLVCLLNRADQGVTGVVEDDVKPTEMRVSLLNDLPDLIGIGHVERQGQNGVAEAFLQIGNVYQFAGGSGDFIAALERGFGPDASKAPRGAGDKPGFAIHSILLRISIVEKSEQY